MKPLRLISISIALLMILPICFADEINIETDANGNLVRDGSGFQREYNGLNQLVRIKNISSDIVIQEFVHDPVEERIVIKKTYENDGSLKETIYYFSQEYVRVINSTGTYDTEYVFMNGQQVAEIKEDGSKTFTHTDHLGSSSVISDENGNTIENTTFEAFGSIIEGGESSRYDYTGQEFDDVLGDYDFDARRYNSERGQFTQPDDLVSNVYDPKSLNHYSYVQNNPYKYYDPDGRDLVVVNVEDGAKGGGHTYSYVGNDANGYTRVELVGKEDSRKAKIEIERLGTNPDGTPKNYELKENERELRYKTTDKEDIEMIDEAYELRMEGKNYNLLTYNCDIFIQKMAKRVNAGYMYFGTIPNINYINNKWFIEPPIKWQNTASDVNTKSGVSFKTISARSSSGKSFKFKASSGFRSLMKKYGISGS